MSAQLGYYIGGSAMFLVSMVYLWLAEDNRRQAQAAAKRAAGYADDAHKRFKLAVIYAEHAEKAEKHAHDIWVKTIAFNEKTVDQWNAMVDHYNKAVTGRSVGPLPERKKDIPS